MATFTYMGDTYPKDSKYAKTMATYMAPPQGEYASELTVSQWNQARDWAKSRSLTLDEMEAVLRGTDYIGTPRSLGGWDDLAQRLNIDTTRKPKKTPKKRRAPKAKNWIQKAIKKPGSLRKSLGVKKGQKIPASKLNKAAKKGGKLGQRARLAKTLKGFKK